MSNHIDITYQKVGHIIMLEEDDWNRIVEYLRSHDLSVTEKSAQQSVQRTACTCAIPDYRPDRDGYELCNNCGGTRRR